MAKLKESLKFRVWFGAVLVAALFSVWVTLNVAPENPFYKSSSAPLVAEEASLIIDFGEERGGGKRLFVGTTIEGMNTYHALFASSEAGGFEVKIAPGEEGVIVEKIDGVENTDTEQWHYYFNGEYKDMLSPQAQPIQAGDKVVFRYE